MELGSSPGELVGDVAKLPSLISKLGRKRHGDMAVFQLRQKAMEGVLMAKKGWHWPCWIIFNNQHCHRE